LEAAALAVGVLLATDFEATALVGGDLAVAAFAADTTVAFDDLTADGTLTAGASTVDGTLTAGAGLADADVVACEALAVLAAGAVAADDLALAATDFLVDGLLRVALLPAAFPTAGGEGRGDRAVSALPPLDRDAGDVRGACAPTALATTPATSRAVTVDGIAATGSAVPSPPPPPPPLPVNPDTRPARLVSPSKRRRIDA